MSSYLNLGHSSKQIKVCVVVIFIINQAIGWINRKYLFARLMVDTTSPSFRSMDVISAEFGWNFLGHVIFAVYFSLLFSMITKGKGWFEGLTFGSIIGLFGIGILFIIWPFFNIDLHLFNFIIYSAMLFIIASILDGIVASFILKKIEK